MLWDRGEGNHYATYFREPLDGMNQKHALIQGALGDFQVANVAMEVMARTMGASVGGADVRTTDVEAFWVSTGSTRTRSQGRRCSLRQRRAAATDRQHATARRV
jgi:hypothetical protein